MRESMVGGSQEAKEAMAKHQVLSKISSLRNALFLAVAVAQHKNKNLLTISRNDFYTTSINETFIENPFIFDIQIENVFFNYARKRYYNDLENYRKIVSAKQTNRFPTKNLVNCFHLLGKWSTRY